MAIANRYSHIDWFVWRLVRAQIGSLQEVVNTWTMNDMIDGHDILAMETKLAKARKG